MRSKAIFSFLHSLLWTSSSLLKQVHNRLQFAARTTYWKSRAFPFKDIEGSLTNDSHETAGRYTDWIVSSSARPRHFLALWPTAVDDHFWSRTCIHRLTHLRGTKPPKKDLYWVETTLPNVIELTYSRINKIPRGHPWGKNKVLWFRQGEKPLLRYCGTLDRTGRHIS